ncbi:putative ABC-type xenobiotic transporter [Helianthus anomalus]
MVPEFLNNALVCAVKKEFLREVHAMKKEEDKSSVVEEYDSPTALLEDTLSSFSQLVVEYSMRSNSSHVTSYI